MIAVAEALRTIEKQVKVGKTKTISLKNSFGLALAEDVYSEIDTPPFRQSSMDGYAFKFSTKNTYKVVAEVAAGRSRNKRLKPNECVRIFTGARVPNDADTVVMQEHVTRTDDLITIEKMPNKLANVREQGEQLNKGDLALKKGNVLDEAAIGFLAGLGVNKVVVHYAPSVSILITGNELVKPGKSLRQGEVYDSNSITLKVALQKIGIQSITIEMVSDNLHSTSRAIKRHMKKSDFVLISGGISVGDYDFVGEALEINRVQQIFYKVNQKPGKPLYFGKKRQRIVFGLPGNPASSLTCFYIYVLPAIRKKMGFSELHLPRHPAVVTHDIENKFDRELFLKATYKNGQATPLQAQSSSMLKSYAVSTALIYVPAKQTLIKKGETVTAIELNF